MSEKKWLDGYSGQSIDELINLAGDCRIDSLVVAIEEALGQKMARVGLSALTDPERVVLAVEALEREVNNGGFEQFFLNDSKAHAPDLVQAFQAIGCPNVARMCQEAIAKSTPFGQLDDGYFEGEDEPIADKLFEYIKNNHDRIEIGATDG